MKIIKSHVSLLEKVIKSMINQYKIMLEKGDAENKDIMKNWSEKGARIHEESIKKG